MRTTLTAGITRRFRRDRETAPHVDEQWAERVLLELRLRGVSGADIGAVLAEVDSHCSESGATAAESFGDPAEYAHSLDLLTEPRLSGRDVVPVAAPMAPQILGMLLVVWSAGGVRSGAPVDVTAGHLVVVAALAVEIALALRSLDAVLALAVRRPVLLWLVFMAAVIVPATVMLVLDDVLLRLPALGTAATGALLLLAGVLLARRGRAAGGVVPDPVVPPLPAPAAPHAGGPGHAGGSGHASGSSTTGARVASAGVWLVPVWTAVMAGVAWWLGGV